MSLVNLVESEEQMRSYYDSYMQFLEGRKNAKAICIPSAFGEKFRITGYKWNEYQKIGTVRQDFYGDTLTLTGDLIVRDDATKEVALSWAREAKEYELELGKMITHRGRWNTLSCRGLQMNELKYHYTWLTDEGPTIKMYLDEDIKEKARGALIYIIYHISMNIGKRLAKWYEDRESSFMSGRHWNELKNNQRLTDEIRLETQIYVDKVLRALISGYYVDNPMFNLGSRARPERISQSLDRTFHFVEEMTRTRLVMFHYGPSSMMAFSKFRTKEEHQEWEAHVLRSAFALLLGSDVSRVHGPLWEGAGAYRNFINHMNEGYFVRCIDGKRWESTVGLILGQMATAISTNLAPGKWMEASGTALTSIINTIAWMCVLLQEGVFDSNCEFYIHSDDLNIVGLDQAEVDAIADKLLKVGVADEDELDTKFAFYLGIVCFMRNMNVHPIGIKYTTDAPDKTRPLEVGKWYSGKMTETERKITYQIYKGTLLGLPLGEYFKLKNFQLSHEDYRESIKQMAMLAYDEGIKNIDDLTELDMFLKPIEVMVE